VSIAEIYQNRQKPLSWIKTANGLMLSAKLSWDALDPLLWKRPFNPGSLHVVVAYWNSFLLLTAFAFENLYRAWLVANSRDWREVRRGGNSHALVKQLSNITKLSEEELRLVKRLETYLLWAGRYTVPWTLDAYADASEQFLESLKGSDFNTATDVYKRVLLLVESQLAAKMVSATTNKLPGGN
jgi:hypothetical protein